MKIQYVYLTIRPEVFATITVHQPTRWQRFAGWLGRMWENFVIIALLAASLTCIEISLISLNHLMK